MKLKLFCIACCAITVALYSCGNSEQKPPPSNETAETSPTEPAPTPAASGDAKGVGKFTNVQLTHPLDEKMIAAGQQTYDIKCASCHKTTGEKLVGPGWKGVTDRRTPEWIMNFITNTDEMLNKNAEAQAMLEICMVRMPNQNLKDEDARAILEFMRKTDGKN
ncbi:cytochrome c family protein [Chitinophaga sp. CF418]|uniref:c-type cytochrome n=1 Tax=Chitinophaga sp. CF418 TaxID=1855287 RepID=UPI0009130D9E|nr:cytochrome c [Chitinophaga sp. CF418]SHN42432.1 Cytochrome c [Chitinophaga sp. CF418]